MQLNEQTILSALQAVQDPDLHKNIVELNFVQNLKIDGTKVSFDLVLTTPACPIRDRFKDQCIAIVKGLGASEVEVTLTSNAGRVGDAPEALHLVLRAKRVWKLLVMTAPPIIIQNESRELAQALALHQFTTETEANKE